MTGTVYDYNKDRIYIMSGEKRVIIDFEDGEYEYWRNNGLIGNRGIEFDFDKKKIAGFM